MIFNQQTPLEILDDKRISSAKILKLFISKDQKFYIPEIYMMRYGLTILKVSHDIELVKDDEISFGPLPILQMDNLIYSQSEFILVLKKIFLEQQDNLENLNQSYLIDQSEQKLRPVMQYFTYFDPDTQFRFRDPYWQLINPIKQYTHFQYMQSKEKHLIALKVNSKELALSNIQELIDFLKFQLNKNNSSGFIGKKIKAPVQALQESQEIQQFQEVIQFVDLYFYTIFKQIQMNLSTSPLARAIPNTFFKWAEQFQHRLPKLKLENQYDFKEHIRPLQLISAQVVEKPESVLDNQSQQNFSSSVLKVGSHIFAYFLLFSLIKQ